MNLIAAGDIEEIIYARLDSGADLLQSIEEVIRERDVQTGLVMSVTGALLKARLQRFTEVGPPEKGPEIWVEPIEVAGPLEASGHGLIGRAYAPTLGDRTFGAGGHYWGHGDIYVHVHLVVTSAQETVCGHLLEGCLVRSPYPLSHFTVVIARMKGIRLRNTADEHGSYHDLVEV